MPTTDARRSWSCGGCWWTSRWTPTHCWWSPPATCNTRHCCSTTTRYAAGLGRCRRRRWWTWMGWRSAFCCSACRRAGPRGRARSRRWRGSPRLRRARGWAFKDGVGVSAVEVLLDGRVLGGAEYGLDAPFVAEYWRNSTDTTHPRVGFAASGRLPGWVQPGSHRLALRVHGRDGSTED